MKRIYSILLIFISIFIMLPGTSHPETKKIENIFDTQNGEIKIESISWKMYMKESKATFNGDVRLDGFKVEGDDITMSCQKLEIYFKNIGKNTSIKTDKYTVEKVIATESVVVKQTVSGGYATAEKAEYLMESEKIFLTGKPYFTDGKGREGRAPVRLILDLKEKSIIAEGTKEDKATLSSTGKDER
jgi:lipopolysaccharide export system protein LptA